LALTTTLRHLYRRLALTPGEAPRDTGAGIRLDQEAFEHRLLQEARYANPKRLNRFEHQVFSQNGEDGALQEIFRRVGTESRTFVEIGVGNGQRNNTTFLLSLGWAGHWMEGNPRSVEQIVRTFDRPLSDKQLTLREIVVTRENAVAELGTVGVPPTVDLLSVDVDRNTYWVLASVLTILRPRVAVIEYNALFPPDVHWTVEYDPSRWWNRTSYYGASLKAYEKLCAQHGLALVGCELHGINAFFVRRDLCGDGFEAPFTAEHHYEPPRYFLVRTQGYPPCFTDLTDPIGPSAADVRADGGR
jgi:hypothetical protein